MRSNRMATVATAVGIAALIAGVPAHAWARTKAAVEGAAQGDAQAALFDPARVVAVDIEVDDDDWNQLCAQKRTFVSLFRGACFSRPFPRPFSWYRARVTIDGETRDNVGVRKKGFLGSLDDVKPSLKVSITEFQTNEPVRGLKKFSLNNAKQDPSYLRQCLGYQLFERAGVPAPRCNFARVTINGRPLGIYVNVEDIRKPMLARYFADTGGNLYEGTVSDFHPALMATFEAQTNEATNDRADLDAVATALQALDADLVRSLGSVVDIDAFITFWAMEALVGQWDGYSGNRNNFYAYRDPASGRFHFLPWGADTILQDGYPYASLDPNANKGIFAYSAITRRLVEVPEIRQRYLATMERLLATVWDERSIGAEMDRIQALLAPHVGDLSAPIGEVRAFVAGQRARILSELAGGVPAFPPLTILDYCLVPNGSISGGFVAEWGTSGQAPPFGTGAAIAQGSIRDASFHARSGGADAGPLVGRANPYEGQLNVFLHLDGGARAMVAATLDPTTLAPGRTLPIDGLSVDAAYLPLDGLTPGVFLDYGTLRTSFASTAPGGKLCGTFEAETYDFSFAPLTGAETTAAVSRPPRKRIVGGADWKREWGTLMQDCQPAGPSR